MSAPAEICYVLEPNGDFLVPSSSSTRITNCSSVPISVKSYDVQTSDTTNAVTHNEFESTTKRNAWWCDVRVDGGNESATAFNMLTSSLGTDYNLSASGNNHDSIGLLLSGTMKNISEDFSTNKQIASVTWTFSVEENQGECDVTDPDNGIAFAVYSDDDKSLDFYKREATPVEGTRFEGKTATHVYTGIESDRYYGIGLDDGDGLEGFVYSDSALWNHRVTNVPWWDMKNDVREVEAVDDGISPVSISLWFYRMLNLEKCDISRIDTSNVEYANATFCIAISMSECILPAFSNSLSMMNDMFTFCKALDKIELGSSDLSGVASMYHFANNSGCTEIVFPSSKPIHAKGDNGIEGCFQNCSSLVSITGIAGWDLSNSTTIGSVFAHCTSLETVDCSGWNTSNVEKFSDVFLECTNLYELDLSGWDLSNAKTMYGIFKNCESLIAINGIANWNTSSVNDMSDIFYNCKSLESIDISSWDTSNVTTLYSAFCMCQNLKQLDIASWDVSNCTSLYQTFLNCSSLENLDLFLWDMRKNASLYRSFAGCEALSELKLFKNTDNVTNVNKTFYNCKNLRELDLSGWSDSNVADTTDCFNLCVCLEKVTVSDSWGWTSGGCLSTPYSTYIADADGNWYNSETGDRYSPSELPNGVNATYVAVNPVKSFAVFSSSNGSLNFYHRINVPKVGDVFDDMSVDAVYTGFDKGNYVPTYDESDTGMANWIDNAPWFDKVNDVLRVEVVDDGISPRSCACWFMMMRNVGMIDISKLDTTRLKSLRATFGRCEKLTELDLPDNLNSVTNVNDAFYCCKSLVTIDLSSFDSSTPRDYYCCFTRCESLENLYLSNQTTYSCPGYIFCHCKKLVYDCSNWNTQENVSKLAMTINAPGITTPEIWHGL